MWVVGSARIKANLALLELGLSLAIQRADPVELRRLPPIKQIIPGCVNQIEYLGG